MRVFPASIPLEGSTVIVIGHGPMAEAKARLFLDSPARLKWFTGANHDPVAADIAQYAQLIHREPNRRDLRGATLVFIAGGDDLTIARLARQARGLGAMVNIVDSPAGSDFQTPALIDRDGIVVSVASGGAAPVLSVDIRSEIERVLPARIGVIADLARELRSTVKSVFNKFDDRRAFWERALRGKARDLALSGDTAGARREMLRELNGETGEAKGIVHLVGAGPGDPDLLTIKAARLLREADVIVFDRLVSQGVLDLARRDAIRIDVGKTKGHHPVPQHAIENILIDHAQSVTFASGVVKKDGPDADYSQLAAPNSTGVFYMGVGAAPEIRRKLIESGRNASTPIAIIENGTTDRERTVTGTLGGLADLVVSETITGPAVIIVGETAALTTSKQAADAAEQIA